MRWCRRSADDSRDVEGSAGGEGEHAGRCARGGADAGQAERGGVRRVCGGGAADFGGGRGGRAGVLSEQQDARIRNPHGARARSRATF